MEADSIFLPGQELAARLFHEAIQPLMEHHAPGVPYASGLLGPGSDVLGYDMERSMDHDWGPRQIIFLAEEELLEWHDALDQMFLQCLPRRIAGFPTRFRAFAEEPFIVHMADDSDASSLHHLIHITSPPRFLEEKLGIRHVDDMDVAAWLSMTEQQLLEVTAGAVFHDDAGELSMSRERLAWYPDDVWRCRMAAAWKRIAQIEPFVGRTGEMHDDLGSQVIGLTLVRDVMRLAILQARHYAPYSKWLGTAFTRIPIATRLGPWLDRARHATSWPEREAGIVGAVRILAENHNALGLTDHIDPTPRPFHARPFEVMDAERFADALTMSIEDTAVRRMPKHLGGIDQYMDSTDALGHRELRDVIRRWLRSH